MHYISHLENEFISFDYCLIGARYGRRATWIGASGDQTFLRIDESLINAHILAASKVFANQKSIGNGVRRKCLKCISY